MPLGEFVTGFRIALLPPVGLGAASGIDGGHMSAMGRALGGLSLSTVRRSLMVPSHNTSAVAFSQTETRCFNK
jgi:hypothetical protein